MPLEVECNDRNQRSINLEFVYSVLYIKLNDDIRREITYIIVSPGKVGHNEQQIQMNGHTMMVSRNDH